MKFILLISMSTNMFSYLSFQKDSIKQNQRMIPITLEFSHITEKNSFFSKADKEKTFK